LALIRLSATGVPEDQRSPEDGSVMWTHSQQRCPLDVKFDRNFIHIVFARVQD